MTDDRRQQLNQAGVAAIPTVTSSTPPPPPAPLNGYPPNSTERGRPFSELYGSGLLWLINRVAFHPRGFRLALVANTETGEVTGWELQGDGSEPHWFPENLDRSRFAEAEATLRRAAEMGA